MYLGISILLLKVWYNWRNEFKSVSNWTVKKNYFRDHPYSMFPIKRTVFFSTVAVHKNTVHLIGNIEYLFLDEKLAVRF